MPGWAELGDLAVQIDCDPAAHADDHRLAVHRLEPLLEVLDDVARNEGQALFGAYHGLELGPLGLELLLAIDLFAFGRLLEARVDVRALSLVEGDLGEAALVVDRDGGLVLDRPLDVVDADVIAKDRPGIGVFELHRSARETDEGGIGQGIAHVARVAVYEMLLAAVRLIGDHDDVPPIRESRMAIALLLREELLQRREHHASGLHS